MTTRRAKVSKSSKPKQSDKENQQPPLKTKASTSATASAFASIAAAAVSPAAAQESSPDREILKSSSAYEPSSGEPPSFSASQLQDAAALSPSRSNTFSLRTGARSKNRLCELMRSQSSSSFAIAEDGGLSPIIESSPSPPAVLIDRALVQVWVPRLDDVYDDDATLSLRPSTASVRVPFANVLNLLREHTEEYKKCTNAINEVVAQVAPKRKRADEEVGPAARKVKRSKNARSALSMIDVPDSTAKYGFSVLDMKNAGLSGNILHKRVFSDGREKHYTLGGKHRIGGPQPDDIVEREDGSLQMPEAQKAMEPNGYSKWLVAKIEEYNTRIKTAESTQQQKKEKPTQEISSPSASTDAFSTLANNGTSLSDTITYQLDPELTYNQGSESQASEEQSDIVPVSTADPQDSQTFDRTPPVTPRRAWVISSLVSTLPRSVSRYMPRFRRTPIPDFSSPIATRHDITAQSIDNDMQASTSWAEPNSVGPRHEPTLAEPEASSKESSANTQPASFGQPNIENTPKSPDTSPAAAQNNTFEKPAPKRTVDGQTKEEFLASQKDLIEEEVRRQVQVAMTTQNAADRTTTVATRRRRLKKKRASRTPSPTVIPNPPNCSYGMNLDYFGYDSSESDTDDEIEQGPPTKRIRLSNVTTIPHAPEIPEASPLSKSYMGLTFTDPPLVVTPFADAKKTKPDESKRTTTNNESKKKISPEAFKGISEEERNYGGHFEVPYSSSDSDEEEMQVASPSKRPAKKTVHFALEVTSQPLVAQSAINQPSTGHSVLNRSTAKEKVVEQQSVSPPPAPTPAHAELPPISIEEASLARAKAEATRYTPVKPSGLRAATRLSSSTVASEGDVGNIDDFNSSASVSSVTSAKDFVTDVNVTSSQESEANKTSSNDDVSNDSAGQTLEDEPSALTLTGQLPNLDPEVAALVYSLPESDLTPIRFPTPGNQYEHLGIDPEVVAALDTAWGPEDEARASEMFRTGYAEYKVKGYVDPSTDPFLKQ